MAVKRIFFQILTMMLCLFAASCASISQSSQVELVEKARVSLADLYRTTPEAAELRDRSAAVLIFPDIFKAGLIVGGLGGNGVLFSRDGQVMGYYNASALSYGLQVGAQSYAEAMFFVNSEALGYLDDSAGWSIGMGPTVVVVESGAGKDLSTTTARSDVYAFIYGQSGLMAGIGVQGQKITKLEP